MPGPQDVIATADPYAVNAETVQRMIDITREAIESSDPNSSATVMVDAFITALAGGAFPKDGEGNLDPEGTVDLSGGWVLIQQMTAQVAYLGLRNDFNDSSHRVSVDQDMIEWAMLAAAQRLSPEEQAALREYHEKHLNPVRLT